MSDIFVDLNSSAIVESRTNSSPWLDKGWGQVATDSADVRQVTGEYFVGPSDACSLVGVCDCGDGDKFRWSAKQTRRPAGQNGSPGGRAEAQTSRLLA